jgi:hypothetical protein
MSTTFKLILIALVHPQDVNATAYHTPLLRIANAWLQRCNLKTMDELLLVGVGFEEEQAFKDALKPYGLAGAHTALIPAADLDESDSEDWQASVGSLVDRWLAERHAGAIAVVDWTHLVPDTAYPWDGWWWVGVKAQESDTDLSDLADTLVELLPDAFKAQAVTWAAILVHVMGLRTTDDEAQAHEAMMQTVALAYWLAGFAAVTDDDFFDFSAADALAVSGLDPLRLGFEAGQQHAAKLGHLFDGNEDSNEALSTACLRACLAERKLQVNDNLTRAFGSHTLLFWSLYRSVWPDFKHASTDNMKTLLNLSEVDYSELERPWLFVKQGWTEFPDD